MKIFVTGGTGFIGRYTVDQLTKTGHELILLVRKTSNTAFLTNQDVTIVEGDLNDEQSLLKGMQGCDSVINIAGHYTFWESDKKIYSDINIRGTQNVMESALKTGIKKIVHVSTAGVFGKPADSPFNEESHPGSIQFSEYFRTKSEGDKIVWDLYEKKGLPVVVIYPVCVLGAGDTKASGKYIYNLINRKLPALILKNKIFSFVYVKDVAQAIVKALEKEDNIGEKYLIGNYRYTWKEINNMISVISGVPLPEFYLPDFITMMNAFSLTCLANLIKKPPLWGLALDQVKVMKAGFNVDGSKAEKELGIKYTPIHHAVEEAINSLKSEEMLAQLTFSH